MILPHDHDHQKQHQIPPVDQPVHLQNTLIVDKGQTDHQHKSGDCAEHLFLLQTLLRTANGYYANGSQQRDHKY